MADNLSEAEIQQAAVLLSRLQPGFLPSSLFHQIARLSVLPIIEVVPLRTNANGQTEILLLERDASDPIWPGQLHTPGTSVRASDTIGTFTDAFRRLLIEELADITTTEPHFVQNIFHHSGRGPEASQIYWVKVTGEPKTGQFYPIDALPANLVKSQLDFIPKAIESYQQYSAKPSVAGTLKGYNIDDSKAGIRKAYAKKYLR